MKRSLLALSIALLSSNAIANDAINFDYVGAGYGKFKIDGSSTHVSFNGFAIEASKKISDDWVISAQYLDTSRDHSRSSEYYSQGAEFALESNQEFDISQWNLGAAYVINLEENSVLELAAHIGRLEADTTIVSRHTVQDSSPFNVEADRSTVYESKAHTTTYGFNINYHYAFSDFFTAEAGIGYEHNDEAAQENEFVYQLGLNYNITPDFTVSALYRNVDAYENHQVTLRYNF
ncbi:hypothetical protein L1286_12805 [Pseudoalteromonas sp. SMS1]|uniref:TonB-dependent receptor domain-containing protein n=1 Tax=Pseudoalteromonas sp. SMS1 TaxID=2908894 RepID=UPI001F2DAEDF|nr:TonB-dependent receptor [Pseudoalteromonas sp. SMS1]MCF2858360.1 hypothetical protein [Pseudoalteromonas sp. SMS1]